MSPELKFLEIIKKEITLSVEERFKEYFVNENFEKYEQI